MLGDNKHLSIDFIIEANKKIYNYLNSNIVTIQRNGKKYSGFLLDIPKTKINKKIGIGSVSIGLSIYSLEKDADSSKMEEMCNFIIDSQLPNGSWTISALRPNDIGLTYTTCYALNALILSNNIKYRNEINSGLDWLLKAVNINEGWGYKETDNTQIFATVEVINLFNTIRQKRYSINNSFENAINNAKSWLLKQKVESYWNSEGNPSIFYTALCYKALISDSTLATKLNKTKNWLISNLNNSLCLERKYYQIDCHTFTHRDRIDCFTRICVVNALLANYSIEFCKEVENEFKQLLKKQNNLGFFSCDDEDIKVPIFLNYYMILALNSYEDYLKRRIIPQFYISIYELFSMFPISTIILFLFCFLGFLTFIFNCNTIIIIIPDIFKTIISFFEKQSGVANLITITGLSIVGLGTFLLNKWKKMFTNKKDK